jgi:hypothetical protein
MRPDRYHGLTDAEIKLVKRVERVQKAEWEEAHLPPDQRGHLSARTPRDWIPLWERPANDQVEVQLETRRRAGISAPRRLNLTARERQQIVDGEDSTSDDEYRPPPKQSRKAEPKRELRVVLHRLNLHRPAIKRLQRKSGRKPVPPPTLPAPGRARATWGSYSKTPEQTIIACHAGCPKTYSRPDMAVAHLRVAHAYTPEAAKAAMPYKRENVCADCGKTQRNLTRHRNRGYCRVLRAREPDVPEPAQPPAEAQPAPVPEPEPGTSRQLPAVDIPRLTDYFRDNYRSPSQSSATRQSYYRQVKNWMEWTEQQEAWSSRDLNGRLLDFGAVDWVRVPLPGFYLRTIEKSSMRRVFHQAYQAMLATMEEFYDHWFQDSVSDERESKIQRHFAKCRRACVTAGPAIRMEAKAAERESKERKRLEGHLSQHPQRVISLVRKYRKSPTLNRYRDWIRNEPRRTVINSGPKSITLTDIRELCMADMLYLQSGHRSDTVVNMTLEEYGKAIFDQEAGCFIVGVVRHKTAGTHGAAMVPILPEVKEMVDGYLRYCRPALIWRERKGHPMPAELAKDPEGRYNWIWSHSRAPDPKAPLFVTTNNLSMKRSHRCAELVRKALVSEGVSEELVAKFHSHVIRVAVSTLAHTEGSDEVRRQAAHCMMHSQNTAFGYQRDTAAGAGKIAALWLSKTAEPGSTDESDEN